jgi:tetratricopeptide (TPR) repeat protein
MPLELHGYRVFISSPSGLSPERETFYRTVLEVNEIEAEARNRSFIPISWDRETAGMGRPQSRLNGRLEECDYLILILADRWGSPTSADSTGFSSGTEEEYNVARRCLIGDQPMSDIVVLFKGVPERQLVDPGPQMQKVLDFKAALEEEKSLLFTTFDDEADLSRILRLHLMRWLRDGDGDEGRPAEPRKDKPPPEGPSKGGHSEVSRQGSESKSDSPLAEAKEAARSGEQAKAEGQFAKAVTADVDDLETRLQYVRFLRHAGRFSHAIEMSREIIALARSRGETEWEIEGLANLGISQRHVGRLVDSRSSLADGIGLAGKDEKYRSTVAYLENNLGLTLRRCGELGQAEAQYTRALRIYEELGDKSGLAFAHINLSYVIREQGDLPQARAHAQRVIDLDPTNHRSIAMAHCNLGLIAEDENELEEAGERFTLALEMNARLKNAAGQAMNYAHLARVKLEQGDEDGARISAGHALDLNEWTGNTEGIAMSLHVIAQIEMRQEKYPLAESRLKDARDIYEVLGQRIGISGTWADLSWLLARTRRIEDARQALAEARDAAEGIEHVRVQNRLKQAEAEVEKVGGKIDGAEADGS